uniref:Putative ribonuclease H-like domain-containing protein n=1 Tax=Tanacetum cinerariifolium TaxID=118510 RepID=A0A6L2K6Y8_TANCI|nr:putative ribonuclease H-like domain-containing protein [Tanacetum cinerariifolium]
MKRDTEKNNVTPLSLFEPPSIDLSNSGLEEFQHPEFKVYGPKDSKSVCIDTSNAIKKALGALIIKDWVSDSDEDESEKIVLKSDNVQHKTEQANQPRKVNGTKPMLKNVGNGTIKREVRLVWNNAMRTNHKKFSNSGRNFALAAVLTKSGIVPISTARQSSSRAATPVSAARPINTAASKPLVNVMLGIKGLMLLTPQHAGFGDLKLKSKIMSPKNSRSYICKRFDYVDPEGRVKSHDGGYVAFEGGAKGGKITGKGTIRTTTKDEASRILKSFITEIENLVEKKVKIIRCDNRTEFKNRVMNEFCEEKGIKREYSVARTPQQNRVAERRNRTLLKEARTMLADSKLPTTFLAEAVNTACYVQNRVLVVKPHFKTPYELFKGRSSALSFMRPFGCHVSILNTLDQLGNFDGKLDEEIFVGYSTTKWLFDIDALSKSTNYAPVFAGTNSNDFTCKGASFDAALDSQNKDKHGPSQASESDNHERPNAKSSTKTVNTARLVNTTTPTYADYPNNSLMPNLEDARIFDDAYDDKDEGVKADYNNLETVIPVSPIPSTRIHKDHLKEHIIGEMEPKKVTQTLDDESWVEAMQEELLQFKLLNIWTLVDLPPRKRAIGPKWVYRNKKDQRGIVVRNKASLVAHEEIFVSQPLGFVDPEFPDRVYKVEKALYDLHQAPRAYVKSASTPMETHKPLSKDANGTDVDVYLYRYLKGQPTLDLWYPKDSPLELIAYSESDYAGASLDRKSTTGGCQFLGSKLISWQCKKQTIMDNSTTEAEYITASNYCGQVLWLQNQLLDYGYNFIQTKIHVYNECAICVVKNIIYHSKTKHIEIRHHFIRDSYEKRLIEIMKIHTDYNIIDLLIEAFDVTRFQFLVASIGIELKVYLINDGYADLVQDAGDYFKTAGQTTTGKELSNLLMAGSLPKTTLPTKLTSARVKKINDEVQIQALIDGKRVNIKESSIRRILRLDDAEGTSCLTNTEIFKGLARMGYEKPSGKLTFYKAFFSPQWKFVQLIINHQLGDMTYHKDIFATPSLTKKVFANMKRVGTGFSGEVTSLFDNMLVQARKEVAKHNVPLPSHDLLPSGEDSLKLKELMDLCTDLSTKVLDLESEVIDIKSTYKAKIEKLESRVERLEEENMVLKELKGVHFTIDSDEPVMEKEESSKQGRKIADIDADVEINLEKVQAKAYNLDLDHQEKKKPLTEAQARSNMIVYLKNMAGYKMNYFKGMSYDKIRPLFEKHYNYNQAFLNEVKEGIKVPEKEVRQEKEVKVESSKRECESLEQEVAKIQKMEQETEELKKRLQIVLDDDDVCVDATPLASKILIVDYKIHTKRNKPYFKIIRADGNHRLFMSFSTMMKNFDREDLEYLWKIIRERFEKTEPKNYSDDYLLNTLKIMFEKHNVEANLWKDQKGKYGLANAKS